MVFISGCMRKREFKQECWRGQNKPRYGPHYYRGAHEERVSWNQQF